MDFGERLRETRKKKQLSQTELSKRVKVHYTQIGRYERGESVPSSEVLSRLASVFETSSDYLMVGSVDNVAKAHLKDQQLLEQFKQIEQLEESDKETIKIFLDAFLTKKKIQELAH